MDQNYSNSQNDFLWTLLAEPADDVYRYNYNLQRLVNDFPQSGILQALLAHSSEEKNLRQASVYFNARSLYKLINAPSSLTGVPNEKIIFQNGNGYSSYMHQDTPAPAAENYFSYDETAATAAGEHPAISAETGHRDSIPASAETGVVESNTENIPAIEPAVEIPAHEQLSDLPVAGYDANTIADVQPAIPGWHGMETPPEAIAETYEAPAAEIQDEHIHEETAAPEPIINYAAGLGRRMAPEEEPVEASAALPVQQEPSAEEHDAGGHGANPAISYEHSAEENINEPHLPPPPPEETLTEVHPVEADLPPTVYEPIATHLPPPVPAESLAESHPAHAETPVTVQAESESVQAPAEEHQPEGHVYDGPHQNNEPVQQYRPWNDTEAEIPEEKAETGPIGEHQPAEEPKPWEQPVQEPVHAESIPETHNIEEETFDEISGIENFSIENDILSSAVAADYFGFDRTFGEHKTPVPEKSAETPAPEPVNEIVDDEQQDLSKYHDEKMPYSFLWWLDKTRKEHSGVYQPYAATENVSEPLSKAKSGADELQQQYYENIFHITSVEELDKSVPVPPQPLVANPSSFGEKKKEQAIIDRFISEEPQIRPQSSDKLDNENKAKKSSEDRDELVSETLAAIYSDQMLYHKAIASYKKLMLKFPEKSRYFAAKIEQLEKKTN